MDTLTRYKAGVAQAARHDARRPDAIPSASGWPIACPRNPEAQPKGTVDGERKLFTGGAADYAGDIKALREVGVTAFDFGLFGPTLAGHARQHATLP